MAGPVIGCNKGIDSIDDGRAAEAHHNPGKYQNSPGRSQNKPDQANCGGDVAEKQEQSHPNAREDRAIVKTDQQPPNRLCCEQHAERAESESEIGFNVNPRDIKRTRWNGDGGKPSIAQVQKFAGVWLRGHALHLQKCPTVLRNRFIEKRLLSAQRKLPNVLAAAVFGVSGCVVSIVV